MARRDSFGVKRTAVTCKMGRSHIWELFGESDKYEEQYPIVIHEMCSGCSNIRHTLCQSNGRRIPYNWFRYDYAEGYREIEVGDDAMANWNLERHRAVRGWRDKKREAVRQRRANAPKRKLRAVG